jgi:orotidine-5'-phosphate decarboxylase
MMNTANEKLIVALDVDSARRALELFEQLRDMVGMFKIGLQLFTNSGPDLVRQIIQRGGRVFLDLKFHDIPNTVALAAVEATRLGISIFNIHASGGVEMMRRTVTAVAETAERERLIRPKILTVTVLTSLGNNDLRNVGFSEEPREIVPRLARVAADCGLDGVVASAQEIRIIREATNASFLIVTPGIRAERPAGDDQQRVMTAAEAIAAGADYIVVGRPVLSASNPGAMVETLLEQVERVLESNQTVSA